MAVQKRCHSCWTSDESVVTIECRARLLYKIQRYQLSRSHIKRRIQFILIRFFEFLNRGELINWMQIINNNTVNSWNINHDSDQGQTDIRTLRTSCSPYPVLEIMTVPRAKIHTLGDSESEYRTLRTPHLLCSVLKIMTVFQWSVLYDDRNLWWPNSVTVLKIMTCAISYSL